MVGDGEAKSGKASGIFERTYTIIDGTPAPMGWPDYEAKTLRAWDSLLASNPSEREVHSFLEQHPCLLPGAFGAVGSPSGHAPHPAAVITQAPLPDFTRKVPDFLWIASDSLSVYPVLIEIEAPAKRWFTKADVPTAPLTQAVSQLTDWKAWFDDPHNQSTFIKHYRVQMHGRALRPQYVLIYGRRAEFEGREVIAGKRAAMQAPDQVLMTYDRLAPNRNTGELMTVKLRRDGFRAAYVPPTLTLGPGLAWPRSMIRSKEAAVDRSPYLTDERRSFLKGRMAYWDDWVKRGATGIRNTGDRE